MNEKDFIQENFIKHFNAKYEIVGTSTVENLIDNHLKGMQTEIVGLEGGGNFDLSSILKDCVAIITMLNFIHTIIYSEEWRNGLWDKVTAWKKYKKEIEEPLDDKYEQIFEEILAEHEHEMEQK